MESWQTVSAIGVVVCAVLTPVFKTTCIHVSEASFYLDYTLILTLNVIPLLLDSEMMAIKLGLVVLMGVFPPFTAIFFSAAIIFYCWPLISHSSKTRFNLNQNWLLSFKKPRRKQGSIWSTEGYGKQKVLSSTLYYWNYIYTIYKEWAFGCFKWQQ